ncbi:hypothetical protein EVAR_43461_1 [Eumeta japonica]|uniref:Uncharacterized protein n=1 Tax=Eumeta variegata TaxID=151549 RepID=A0A4C1YEH0_EUMVA|nr:hypothetical protein EVAR_43461_1 [Eumeta japonica]
MYEGWKRRFVIDDSPKDDQDPITQDEIKQSRRAADAPWYFKNSELHWDLELSTISKFMEDASERFFDIVSSHPNPLIISAVSYEPPPPHHFCRRLQNILSDPPDDLTVEVEKLIEANRMATD